MRPFLDFKVDTFHIIVGDQIGFGAHLAGTLGFLPEAEDKHSIHSNCNFCLTHRDL